MLVCMYCSKEIERKVFCKRSHQVMFNRKLHKQKESREIKDNYLGIEKSENFRRGGFELCKKHNVFLQSCGCE